MFKYQTYFEKLNTPCPPIDYLKIKKEAFRWVFEDFNTIKNFKPVYFKNPKRFNDKTDEEKCISMGLSFFDSLSNAENRFVLLKKRIGPECFKIFGTQIARGLLDEEDGICSKVDKSGHFTVHPFSSFKYDKKMIIVKNLK